MKPLKPAFRNAALAVAFVGILVAADLASGLDLLDQLPLPGTASDLRRFQQEVERAWQGGGGQTLFADDFSALTADWLAKEGAGLPGYYGGALPELGDGPTRWAQDLYRWGHAATALGSADGWSMEQDGYVEFGDPAVGYPSNVKSELVSPVIDLRGLPTFTEDAYARVSANPDPLAYGSRQCPPPPTDNLGPINSQGCAIADRARNATAQLGFDDGRRTVEPPVREASAALRVRHAYGFRFDATGFVDGGRVVVAALDPGTNAWGPWIGLTPTDSVLQVGEEQMRVRRDPGVLPVEVQARKNVTLQGLLAGNLPTVDGEVIVDDGITVDSGGPDVAPRDLDEHLYQGTIVASGSASQRWRGFGGDSGGMVDSIFDLSPYAGRLVRLGFQVATAAGDEPLVQEGGWRLDDVLVHASGSPTVLVVGLAEPGNGAALPPGSDVRPTLILQNTGADAVEIVASTTAGGETESRRARLSVGPLGRIHFETGHAFDDLEAGLVPVEVNVRHAVEGSGPVDASAQRPEPTIARFHFLAADATGWQEGRLGFFPDGVPREKATKLVVRGQKANITLELENLGTAPATVRLGSSTFAPNGTRLVVPGDVRAKMVDESGAEYGTMRPVAPDPLTSSVVLPVSRAIAGTGGTPMAARVATWEWSGSDVARALRLQVVDGDGQVLREGGDVMVQTVAPNPLDIEFSNLWNFAAGTPACSRVADWGGEEGVIQCPAGQARVVSAVRRLFEIDLFRGNETHLLLTYRGGPINATIQAVKSSSPAPDPLPPANAVWQTIGQATFPASPAAWKTVIAPGPQLPAGFIGHVRLVLQAKDGSGFDLDEAGHYLKLRNSQGSEVSVPVVADRFDVTLAPSKDVILPTQPSGLVVLDGIDEAVEVVRGLHPTGGETPQSRFVEDSILTFEQTIDLTGKGRPMLSFRHWLDTGFHGTATVEVAPASKLPDQAQAAADSGAGVAAGWQVLARFNGTDTGRNTIPAMVSLWDYTGQVIRLRFRFHIDPSVLTAEVDGVAVFPGYPPPNLPTLTPPNPSKPSPVDVPNLPLRRTQDAMPAGWLIEGITVTAWGDNGPWAVHKAEPGFTNYTWIGGHIADPTAGHSLSNLQSCWNSALQFNPGCQTPHGVSSLMSEPMLLDNMERPVLTLVHSGDFTGTPCDFGTSFPAMDIEYQRMAGDIPADPWAPGTPTEGFTWPRDWFSQMGWRRTDQVETLPLRTLSGALHGPPFAGTHELSDQNGCRKGSSPSLVPDGYEFGPREDVFDLSPLKPMDEGARIRLDVWSEKGYPPGNEHLVVPVAVGPYDVDLVRIAELRQFIDAKVESITTVLDDRSRLKGYDPKAAQELGIRDQVVIARDVATFVVAVSNVGQADIEVDVSLRAAPLVGTAPIDVTWMEDLGSSLRAAGVPTGHVKVESGETVQVIFQANFLEAPPGQYRLAARVDATTGVDTAPANDLLEQDLVVLPFRRIEIESGDAAVTPFAAEAKATKTIHATVANQGNVDETNVKLRADVVRMTGLTSFQPLVPEVKPTALGATTLNLDRRGDGRVTTAWTLGPENVPQGTNVDALFPPGEKYAVRLRADPEPGSVKAWWPGQAGKPLNETTDGKGLLNLTVAPNADCSCILIPFLVERLLYSTNFSPGAANSTTILPDVLPVDTVDQLMGHWTATTVVDDVPLAPGERADIPRWKRASAAEAAATFPGAPTGNAWMLPAYSGLEEIQQILESPALPSHVVKGASRSILAMTYASGVPQGQAFLESRSLVGGQWTPWAPIDAMRAQRVAIVLAHDFPRVTPTGIGSDTLAPGDVALSGANAGKVFSKAATKAGAGSSCFVDNDGDGVKDSNDPAYTGTCGVPVCYWDSNGDGLYAAADGAFVPCQVNLRDGGLGRFCYVDADRDGGFDTSEPAYLATECLNVAAGDVRLANPALGGQVAVSDPDAGLILQSRGFALGLDGRRWIADLDGNGLRSVGDVVLAGDAVEPSGTVLTPNSEGLAGPLAPGTLHRAYIDSDGNGVYGSGDIALLHTPLLTAARQYETNLLRGTNHPGPSWYGNPLNLSHIKEDGGEDTPEDQAPQCNWSDVTSLPLCNWGAPLRFDVAGNEAWAEALDRALIRFSRSLGADNIGLFSTVGSSGSAVAIGHWEGGSLVHTVRDGLSTHRFPIRDLNALGVDLDHYGAILLMGDGSTKAFASESEALQSLRHGPGDTADSAWLTPAERQVAKLHHDRLFAILNAAASSGIRVVGSLGPAAATLARSGAVPDASLAAWQTFRYMPDILGYTGTVNLYCTGIKPAIGGTQYTLPAPGAQHPIDPCMTKLGGTQKIPDKNDHHNYRLVSPFDQQSAFIREMVERNGDLALSGTGQHFPMASITKCGGSSPEHVFLGMGSFLCDVLKGVEGDQVGALAVLTAARPENVDAWVDLVTSVMGTATGELPAGGWQPLPPNLSFPVGGRFLRRADGSDEFDGRPTQVRIRILGDDTTQGHGAFALDRIALLGTNRTQGLGVEFAAPVDGRAYTPGSTFDVAVTATNRGVQTTPATQAVVTMERWDRDGCSVQPWEPVTVTVPRLEAGTSVTLPALVNGGLLPDSPACPKPALQMSLYNLTARLPDGRSDDDPRDDQQRIQILGRQVSVLDSATLTDFSVTPARAAHGSDVPIRVAATVKNLATSTQLFRMEVVLEHARPLVCERNDNPATTQDDNLYGCTPDSRDDITHPIPLPQAGIKSLDLLSGESGTLELQATAEELGLEPGLYRVSVRLKVTDSASRVLTYPPETMLPLQRMVRLTPDADPEQARAEMPPDGAFGFQSDDLDALWASGSLAGPGSAFMVSNEGVPAGSHSGAYGMDPTTRDGTTGQFLKHGWALNGCTDTTDPFCPTDSTRSVIVWQRDGTPSYRAGVDPAMWDQSLGTPDGLGYGDFGPDTLVWLPTPQNLADQRQDPEKRVPYLSLASYDAPMLSFLTRFDFNGAPNTAFVVEMQVAQRITCASNAPSASGHNCMGSGWTWGPAFPLKSVEPQDASLPPGRMVDAFATVGSDPKGLGNPPMYWNRYSPSNPLAGLPGFWGQQSGRHDEDQGWMRVHIPLTEAMQQGMTMYCRSVATAGGPNLGEFLRNDRDPCGYAHASDGDTENGGETYVARPVRFRFRAASHGGDAGASSWQIADLSVTDHRLRFLGPPQVSVTMQDDDTRLVPVRIANQGSVPDRVDVAWTATRSHAPTLGRNGSIALSTMPDMRDAAEHLVLDLAPGQSRVVWVRIHTGILDSVNPGSTQHIPFLVRAQSLLDPVLVEEVLVDAKFTTNAWPDLVATKLVVGDSESQGSLVDGSLGSPLKAVLSFRNLGELAIGSPSQPVRVSLVAEELDENGTAVPGTRQVVDQKLVGTEILPYRQDSKDHFVSFAEWLPDHLGLFRLSAELNAAGNLPPLPESSRSNNAVVRFVAVGPIRYADLNLAGLWAVEFQRTCGTEPVERLIAGHAYCLAARVENRGLRTVLEPRVDFGVGASAPFSSGAPSLIEMLDGAPFPAAEPLQPAPSRVVYSVPRAIVAPPASSSGLVFYAEASARSIMPVFEGKSIKLTLPVDVFTFGVEHNATAVDLSPGREVRIPLTLSNRGNAPATAGVVMAGDDVADLEVRLDGVRTLLANETAEVMLTLAAGQQLDTKATLGALSITVAEDPRVAIPLGIDVKVADSGLPEAQLLSVRVTPGLTNATLVLDAASSPVPYRWRAEAVAGLLQVPAGWQATTQPFDRSVVQLPLSVASTAPPGLLEAPLRLVAEHGGVRVSVPFNVTLDVAPRPALSAQLVLDHRTAAPGAQAAFVLRLNNTGNVPLSPSVVHRVDLGAVTPDTQAAALLPGEGALLPFTALAGPFPRALGETEVAWSTAAGRTGVVTLPWKLDVMEARFEIAGGLPDLRPTAGKTSQVQVPVMNTGTGPAEAEVLLAIDGVLQSRRTVTLDPGEVRQVALPFKAGASGATQNLEVLVRPAGSDAWLGDAALYDAGDVGSAKVEPVADSSLPVPGLDALFLLVACLALAAIRRRRA